MGAAFIMASFADNDVTASEAGRRLARLFAVTLVLTGTFTFLLGVGLLRAERGSGRRYVVPVLVGGLIGALEAVLFLAAAGVFLLAPLVLTVLVFHPVRRFAGRVLQRPRERSR